METTNTYRILAEEISEIGHYEDLEGDK